MDLQESGWILVLGAVLLLLNRGVRRMLGKALEWAALAAFLYGVYQAFTFPFDKGISQLVTWSLIAGALMLVSKLFSPGSAASRPSPGVCTLCKGTGLITCDCAIARMTGARLCLECGGGGWKPCPSCR